MQRYGPAAAMQPQLLLLYCRCQFCFHPERLCAACLDCVYDIEERSGVVACGIALCSQVVQERQHAIDAAIVRVMKMRKTLAHKLLVQEVMTQLRFQLTNADLKRRIDNLIEREFLERSATDSQVYNYLA